MAPDKAKQTGKRVDQQQMLNGASQRARELSVCWLVKVSDGDDDVEGETRQHCFVLAHTHCSLKCNVFCRVHTVHPSFALIQFAAEGGRIDDQCCGCCCCW